MTDFNKIFPDWTLKIDEISNNVFQFNSTKIQGNQVEFTDSDYDTGIKRIFNETFDLEIQICKETNKLIFDTFSILLDNSLIKDKKYESETFGSWIIGLKNKRIILDGKESILSLEKKKGLLSNDWVELKSINIRDGLKYEDIEMIINEI
ncbi:MAG TPA: hypothetical protein DDX92_12660 [Flavobacteriales bacterium]|jgi:hypothetical protein|nr:hypothetical protein [Flavobacteriales bacterium]